MAVGWAAVWQEGPAGAARRVAGCNWAHTAGPRTCARHGWGPQAWTLATQPRILAPPAPPTACSTPEDCVNGVNMVQLGQIAYE